MAPLQKGQQEGATLAANVLPGHHANTLRVPAAGYQKWPLPRQLQDLLDDGIRHIAKKANVVILSCR
jgi:hypothetical protein